MFECRNMERHRNVGRKAASAVERINVQGRRILSAGNTPLEVGQHYLELSNVTDN